MTDEYINITQDGIGILLNDQDDGYIGCFTEGLETCFAITLVGEKGIALIHNTGKMSKETIRSTCESIAPITECNFYYNPKCYGALEYIPLRALIQDLSSVIGEHCTASAIVDEFPKKARDDGYGRGYVSIKKHIAPVSPPVSRYNTEQKPANIKDPIA